MRNPLAPAPIPNGQDFLLCFVGFIVALSLLAGIAAVYERGKSNWTETRAEWRPT